MKDERSLIPSLLSTYGAKGVIDSINKLEQTFRLIGSYLFAENETPVGAINGTNKVFKLANNPYPDLSLRMYLNGIYMTPGGEDYTLSGTTITFVEAPATGSVLRVFYRYKI